LNVRIHARTSASSESRFYVSREQLTNAAIALVFAGIRSLTSI
jgi:hypothetical protein